MKTDLILVLSGATAMGSAAVALMFLRYWVRTRDELFAAFAIAFGMFALSRVAAAMLSAEDHAVWAYALRCAAFAVILIAIIRKNGVART